MLVHEQTESEADALLLVISWRSETWPDIDLTPFFFVKKQFLQEQRQEEQNTCILTINSDSSLAVKSCLVSGPHRNIRRGSFRSIDSFTFLRTSGLPERLFVSWTSCIGFGAPLFLDCLSIKRVDLTVRCSFSLSSTKFVDRKLKINQRGDKLWRLKITVKMKT